MSVFFHVDFEMTFRLRSRQKKKHLLEFWATGDGTDFKLEQEREVVSAQEY